MPDQFPTKEPVLVFIHLPKTGGTTLKNIIFREFPRKKIFHIVNTLHRETFLQMSDEKRNEFDCITGHVPTCIHNFISRPCRYIILLREPLERAISDYYFILTSVQHPRHERYNREKVTLEEHLRKKRGSTPDIIKLLLYPKLEVLPDIPIIEKWRGFESYTMNEMIEESKRKLREDFFQAGVLDRFGEFVFLLSRRLRWKFPYYRTENRSSSRFRADARNTIDTEVLSHFYAANRIEYQLYEYACSLFAAQWSESGISGPAVSRYRMINRFLNPFWSRLYGIYWHFAESVRPTGRLK